MNQTTATTSNTDSKPNKNHAIWIGPLLAIAGVGGYFAWFIRDPALRDVPWTSLLIMSVGIMISAVGVRRAYDSDGAFKGKLLGPLGLLFSMSLTTGFYYLLFFHTYHIPIVTEVTQQLTAAPDFELVNQHGESVRLSDYRGHKVVLDFYRGHW